MSRCRSPNASAAIRRASTAGHARVTAKLYGHRPALRDAADAGAADRHRSVVRRGCLRAHHRLPAGQPLRPVSSAPRSVGPDKMRENRPFPKRLGPPIWSSGAKRGKPDQELRKSPACLPYVPLDTAKYRGAPWASARTLHLRNPRQCPCSPNHRIASARVHWAPEPLLPSAWRGRPPPAGVLPLQPARAGPQATMACAPEQVLMNRHSSRISKSWSSQGVRSTDCAAHVKKPEGILISGIYAWQSADSSMACTKRAESVPFSE